MNTVIVYMLLLCSLDASWECGAYRFETKGQCEDVKKIIMDEMSSYYSVRCQKTKVFKYD